MLVFRFRPRILRDVSRIDMSTAVLGYNISAPILIAPTAMHKLAHLDGIDLLMMFLMSYFWKVMFIIYLFTYFLKESLQQLGQQLHVTP